MDSTTTLAVPKTYSAWKFIIGGFVAGLVAMAVNSVWFVLFPIIYDAEFPPQLDEMSLAFGSIGSMVVASIFYYIVSLKSYETGTKIYLPVVLAISIASVLIQFFPEFLVQYGIMDAQSIPDNLALITVPFHIVCALTALIFIPKFTGMKDE